MGRRCFFFTECDADATIIIPSSKMPLCNMHFIKYTENRVWKLIDGNALLNSKTKEKILVAVSGGKDSQALLVILDELFHKRIHMEAVFIDLKIGKDNYSENSLRYTKELCDKLDIPLNTVNIMEEQQYSIDDIISLKQRFHEKGKSNRLSKKESEFVSRGECSFCGEIKRYHINKFAAENGFTKVYTGHNMNDEATKFLQNLISMNLLLLVRSGPVLDSNNEQAVPRLKPLYFISEQEVILYTYLKKIPHIETNCPYSKTPSKKFRKIIEDIDGVQNGAIYSLMKKYQKTLKPLLVNSVQELNTYSKCNKCGMLSSRKKCAYCRTTEFIHKYLFMADAGTKTDSEENEFNLESSSDHDSSYFISEDSDFALPDFQNDVQDFYMDELNEEEKSDFE